jgi:hypothetical protein
MKSSLDNFKVGRRWKLLVPLLPAALLPMLALGFSVRPAVEYGTLERALETARARADLSSELSAFVAGFGEQGPPTERYERFLADLAALVPTGFEAADFYERCLRSKRASNVTLGAINVGARRDLAAPVGELSLHECVVTLQGRARLADLPRLLAELHDHGQPVGVLQCRLEALEDETHLFDFQLELAVYHLAPPTPAEAATEDI